MEIKNIAIDEMNFLQSRCHCVGCSVADVPSYDQDDFDTLEDYHDYLTNSPACVVCEDKGYYYEGEHDEQRKETCYCRLAWCGGVTEDDLIQDGAYHEATAC